jgi:hypothetical protein
VVVALAVGIHKNSRQVAVGVVQITAHSATWKNRNDCDWSGVTREMRSHPTPAVAPGDDPEIEGRRASSEMDASILGHSREAGNSKKRTLSTPEYVALSHCQVPREDDGPCQGIANAAEGGTATETAVNA